MKRKINWKVKRHRLPDEVTITVTNWMVFWIGLVVIVTAVIAIVEYMSPGTGIFQKISGYFSGQRIYFWFVGFAFSLVIGNVVTGHYVKYWQDYLYFNARPPEPKTDRKWIKTRPFPPKAVGITEGFIFTLFVAITPTLTGVLPVLMGWIVIKMGVGWSRTSKLGEEDIAWQTWKSNAFVSLFGNLLSMSFALGGGMICRISLAKDVPDLEENFILPLLGLFH